MASSVVWRRTKNVATVLQGVAGGTRNTAGTLVRGRSCRVTPQKCGTSMSYSASEYDLRSFFSSFSGVVLGGIPRNSTARILLAAIASRAAVVVGRAAYGARIMASPSATEIWRARMTAPPRAIWPSRRANSLAPYRCQVPRAPSRSAAAAGYAESR